MQSFIKNWTQREFDNLTRSFRRFRIIVFILKFSLPIIVLTIVVALVLYAESDSSVAKISVENAGNNESQSFDAKNITAEGVMEKPRFQGIDGTNQAFSIAAERGWQQGDNEVMMEKITADITLKDGDKDGNWVSILAGEGNYFIAENEVSLRGGVEIFMTGGAGNNLQIQTDAMHLNMKTATAFNDSKLTVNSDMGEFTAFGFLANREEQKISFKGPLKMVILP